MKISRLVEVAHGMSVRKGWWENHTKDGADALDIPPDSIAAKLMLIVAEVSGACECVRDGDYYARKNESGKPKGLPSELAGVVIRVADLCGAMGIALEDGILDNLEFSDTRKHRQGGRIL